MEIIDNIFELFTSPKTLFEKINDTNNLPRLLYPLIALVIVNAVFFTSKYDFKSSRQDLTPDASHS